MKTVGRTNGALTNIELLAVVAIVAILAAAAFAALSRARAKAHRIRCVGRLKNIGLANRIFATDNSDLFPWERAIADATNRANFPDLTGLAPGDQVVRIYRSLSNELSTPKIIACPADSRKAARTWPELTTNSISYFVGLSASESLPQTPMAGDRNLIVDGQKVAGRLEITSRDSVGWDGSIHRYQGSAAMGDGSVQQLSSARLKESLANTGVETNVLLIP